MTYEIEKNIEMKLPTVKHEFKRKYPFDDMEVGDSFVVDLVNRERIRVACSLEGKRKGKRFKVAKDINDIVRCWRLE